jgi:hypothetical protein
MYFADAVFSSAAERLLSLAVYFSARIGVAICFSSRVATVEFVAPFAHLKRR